MSQNAIITVTKPYFPEIGKLHRYIDQIYKNSWLTNNGPLLQELEQRLKVDLNLMNILVTSNGTIAIQMALKALNLTGSIITTPFSYVATTSSIVWEGLRPIYVDINPHTCNIDVDLIEQSIEADTTGILATHCFGNPCEITAIQKIAKKYNLKVIYDAAHCFGSQYEGQSIYNFGDISIASFHATKIFHMVEGGALISSDNRIIQKLRYIRNFGHNGPEKFCEVGINGKNSEFHAAMGLAVLEDIDLILQKRREQHEYYASMLNVLPLHIPRSKEISAQSNYSYFPIILHNEQICLTVKSALEKEEIYTRRYFYPSLSTLYYVPQQETPVSDDIASKILCLPLYYELTASQQDRICEIIKRLVI